jgi:hypothetical protein
MRAHTKGKHDMGKRFAIVIGVAAAGVMALGAQSAAAAPGIVKYDTKLTIFKGGHRRGCHDRPPKTSRPHCALWHGGVESDRDRNPSYDEANAVWECMARRRVTLFKQRPGADRKLGTDGSKLRPEWGEGFWGMKAPERGRVYAKVTPKVGDGFVCSADRSRTVRDGRHG